MGGRSREPEFLKADGFAFVSELSDERLNSYGNYSSAAVQNWDGGSTTEHGIPKNTETLNNRAADEYIKRTGQVPAWDLRVNGGLANSDAVLAHAHETYYERTYGDQAEAVRQQHVDFMGKMKQSHTDLIKNKTKGD